MRIAHLFLLTLLVAVVAFVGVQMTPTEDEVGAVALCARVEYHNYTNYTPTVRMAWFLVNKSGDRVALYKTAIYSSSKSLGPPPLELVGEDISLWWEPKFPDPPHDWGQWQVVKLTVPL